MGYNNRDALRVIFDLETVPLPDAADYIDTSEMAAPSNWKDEAKIKANIEEQKTKAVARAALDIDLCRIVALGWMPEDTNEPTVKLLRTPDPAMEAALLRQFWDELDERATVGKNSLGFDFPVLLRRSMYLGVQAPAINLDKYRTPHIDLQQRLTFNGTVKPTRSLDFYCKRLRIDVPDTVSGKDIGALVAAEQWDAVIGHCRADVLKTKALAEKMGLLKQQLEPVEAF